VQQFATQVLTEQADLGFLYGQGPALLLLKAMVHEVAPTDIPVLVFGESGTGKDAYATLIHRLSRNSKSPLHKINCSGLQPSELLDHVKEAVARCSDQPVLGSIYLDNIQELDLTCQRILLSHLPDVEGAGSRTESSPRLVSSTNRNLEPEVEAGRFSGDLFFRLNGACLRIPPLRERREDIQYLTEFFLEKHGRCLNKKAISLSRRDQMTLEAYHWPGNLRELDNLLRKMIVFGDVQAALNDLQPLKAAKLSYSLSGKGESLKAASRAASRQAERELILQALERTRWNRKRAAQELRISYKSLLYKLKEIGSPNGKQEN
jgi:two-component system, NtrC family, response regulator AtoC